MSSSLKVSRARYPQAYKEKALKLADKAGVAQAARPLGRHESPLYAWRKQRTLASSDVKREQQLNTANARLKRQLAEQEEELVYGRPRRTLRVVPSEVRFYAGTSV